jgi:hypothetical protein
MPTIRIDDAVFAALQKRAEPLVDTTNDVLRRLLEIDAAQVPSAQRRKPGQHKEDRIQVAAPDKKEKRPRVNATQPREYRIPIARALFELGGGGQAEDVLRNVFQDMKGKLKPVDLEDLPQSGEPRWRLYARFERKNMLTDSLIKPTARQGLWELTDKGMTLGRKGKDLARIRGNLAAARQAT